MSHLEKMQVLGVRSFGPEQRHSQSIDFSAVTLILGPNGTGKTTIIECLKFITTGDQPPNTKGGAFVHDPKMCGETEVKAQVKLQFRDVTGARCVAARSLLATQKLKKIEVKTIDSTIKRRKATGEEVTLTSRCADITGEMISALGVSKPILQNVIFCHQEESSWPLSEGKALKEKFDDIFASTRYVKALESILKIKKEKAQEVSTMRAEIKYLKQYKEKAEELNRNLATAVVKHEGEAAELSRIEAALQPVQEKIDKLLKDREGIEKIKVQIGRKETDRQHISRSCQDLQRQVKQQYEGSDKELEDQLRETALKTRQINEARVAASKRQTSLDTELNGLRDKRAELQGKKGSLEQEEKVFAETIIRRDAKLKSVAREYSWNNFEGTLTDAAVTAFADLCKKEETRLQSELEIRKAEYSSSETEILSRITESRVKKAKLDESERLKEETRRKKLAEAKTLSFRIGNVEAAPQRLTALSSELASTEDDLKALQESPAFDVAAAPANIQHLQQDKARLSNELSAAHHLATDRAELDRLSKVKAEKEEELRRRKGKVEDTVIDLLQRFPTEGLVKEMDIYLQNLNQGLVKDRADLQKLTAELASSEQLQKSLREDIQKNESRRAEIAKALLAAGGAENFESELAALQDHIAEQQDEKGLLSGVKEMYSRYYKKLKDPAVAQSEHKCPLCKRYFGENSEVDELAQMLDSQLQSVPQKMELLDRKLKELLRRSEDFQRLRPQKELLSELDSELPGLKGKSESLASKIGQLKVRQSELESNISMRQDDLHSMNSVRPDAAIIDRAQAELKEVERKLLLQQNKLSGAATRRSVIEVQEEHDTTYRALEQQQQQLSTYQEQVQRLKTKANDLLSEKLQLQQGLQERMKLVETRRQLTLESETLSREIEDIRQQMSPLEQLIVSLETELATVANEKKDTLEKSRLSIQKLQFKFGEIQLLNKETTKYKTGTSPQRLADVQQQLQQLENEVSSLTAEKESLAIKSSVMTAEHEAAMTHYNNLKTCKDLRAQEAELARCDSDIDELKAKLGGVDTSEKGERTLRKEQEDLLKKKHTAIERRAGLLDQKRTIEKELQSAEYKNAFQAYQDKLICLKTNEMAISDLDKYYRALDRAIMTYHQTKMTELNRIIRELWRSTYRGADIDAIEIRSEDDGDSEAATEVKNRRTYNYRVVMMKGDAVLDMRGRCSAGQKVLASLLIRLALAETFCINFGMLALDEPTTNLDRENIESLAYALDTIIKKRTKQKNFQLVIITHDESFIELIGRTVGVENYYRVSKSHEDGCTVIRRKPIESFGL